ncbi:MAG: CHAT domain-containing protein [Acidobacteriota bacterium]
MTDYLDFDLELTRYDEVRFTAVVRRVEPDDKTVKRTEITTPLAFDFAALNEAKGDPAQYGRLLTHQLFAEGGELRLELRGAIEAAAARDDRAVRFRLSLSQSAPRLHSLRWETLRDPEDDQASLLTNENIVFSRHVYTSRGKALRGEKPAQLKALVAVAAPADLAVMKKSGYPPLAPIEYAAEVAAATRRLAGFAITPLAKPGAATLDGIFDALRAEPFEVFYLVCHGAPGERPRLVLEDEAGNRDVVDASDVVQRMRELENPPPLVVLASCRSAGAEYTTSGESVARLGPDLAVQAGTPVVLAMQGDVTIESASTFLEKFFEELHRDVDIDRAVTVARGAIRERSDAWMPVLYMRLNDGRLWASSPSLSSRRRSFERWDSLLNNISRGKCTPILGFGVYEQMFGDASTLARRWGETYRYPLHEDDELPEIAQYLSINQDSQFPRDELIAHYRRETLRRYGDRIDPKKREELPTDELIVEAWRTVASARDPHRILANLPCSLYLTANLATVLEAALSDAHVQPQSAICHWNEGFREPPLPADLDIQRPLVYHLFGRLDQEKSIVLTEDNYFDYLVASADGGQGPHTLGPDPLIRSQAHCTSLMLLGFRITDWNLRVLFRTLMNERRDETFTHVAVQVDPDQPGIDDLERVNAYLDRYFGQQDITIFQGSVTEFVDELVDRWKDKFKDDLTAGRVKVRPK